MPRGRPRGTQVESSFEISPLQFSGSQELQDARDLTERLEAMTPEQYEDRLSRLNPYQRRKTLNLLWGMRQYESAHSLEYFARFVKTQDAHADGSLSERPFPDRESKPYLWEFLDACQRESLFAVEKSRQIMITWSACLYCFWRAKYTPNRLIFIQSKKEEDAANLVYNKDPFGARIAFMEHSLPPALRTVDFGKNASYGQIVFPDTHSKIWGIPEGGDIIRSYTASVVFSDEFAFQPEAAEAYKALKPTISGGGQFICVSTARSGAFMKKLIKRFDADTQVL